MSPNINNGPLTATWLLALTAALSMAAGTISLVAWISLALIGLIPPVMLSALSNTPERTAADVIRDVEAGRAH